MELIPKSLVAGMLHGQILNGGGFAAVGGGGASFVAPMPTTGQPMRDIVNRVWSEVIKKYPYQGLQLEPSGRGGAFVGSGPQDLVVIQPPIIQVRATADNAATVRQLAEKASFIFTTVMHHLGSLPPVNLGIKIIYNAPAPGGDAAAFIRSELVKAADDLSGLAGSMTYTASLKINLRDHDRTYALLIEPLVADNTLLFVDLDAQFPGFVDLQRIESHINEVDAFVTNQVRSFLESRATEWGTQ